MLSPDTFAQPHRLCRNAPRRTEHHPQERRKRRDVSTSYRGQFLALRKVNPAHRLAQRPLHARTPEQRHTGEPCP